MILAACGFTPLYEQSSAARLGTSQIRVAAPADAFEFTLRERLVNRLRQTDEARFTLALQTEVTEEGRAIRADNTITRFTVRGRADFSLQPIGGGQPVFRDSVRSSTGYSAVASAFATRSAQEDARRRLAQTLADQIVLRLSASAENWAR